MAIVRSVPAPLTRTLGVATCAALLALVTAAAPGVAKVPACTSFSSQAAAQELFVKMGGSPGHSVGRLDDDRDGVACEELSGPYEGYATIGYNRAKRFFYGTATMPDEASGDGEFACLYGNRHFADGPRLLKVYRAVPGPDRPVSGDIGTQAEADKGRLLWKLDRQALPAGSYYATFEERIRSSPYAPSECPGFSSRVAFLPRPQR